MELGDKAYCVDPKTKKIFEATVTGFNIAQTGYKLLGLLTSTGESKSLEAAHCHATKPEAEAHLERVMPLMAEADDIMEKGKKRIDELRIGVLGEPELKDLAEEIMNPKPKLEEVKQ